MREFDYDQYWIRLSPEQPPEVARHDHGIWRLVGYDEPIDTADIWKIGRRVVIPFDASDRSEQTGQSGQRHCSSFSVAHLNIMSSLVVTLKRIRY